MPQLPKMNIPCDGYPASAALAVKQEYIGDHFGSNSYQIGGYPINCNDVGLNGFEWVAFTGGSNTGNYTTSAVLAGASGNTEQRARVFPSITMQWYYANNGNEVANNTNLSAECIRLFAIGI
jgi:hypothetical protein